MAKNFDFDKDSFLKQGALFGRDGEVCLLWGEPQVVTQRPEAIAILSMDFHEKGHPFWLLFPYAIQVSMEQARELFQSSKSPRKFHEASRDNFQNQFKMIQDGFEKNNVEKVVPYVFETSPNKFSMVEKEGALHSLMNQKQGFMYGLWNNESGFMGLTPEILLSQFSDTQFETMALAGTMPIDRYEKDPKLFISDHKEKNEHLKVVEDIVAQLEELGTVALSDTTIEKTPHLAHLKTTISFESRIRRGLLSLVKTLHPTPALGCFPREKNEEYMAAFEKIEPRGNFGAPFGISYSQKEADVVVAIRNIIWENDELKIGSGCGVVKASTLASEWEELTHKRNSVKKIFGLL